MPEPNLPPLHVAVGPVKRGCVSVDALKEVLPELPEETRSRLKDGFGLTPEQAIILVVGYFFFLICGLKRQLMI